MLKKLFAAIVSAAMLFCMSTSALSVHAEDPVSITIEGAENDTIDLYFRENSNIETVRGRRFLLEPHEEFDELEFSVIDGEEVLSIPWIYKLDRDEWNGQVWFNFLSEGTAVVQASIGDTVIKTFTVNTHLGKYVNRFETRESYLNILVGEELNLRDYVLSMAYPAGADYSDEEFTYRIDYDTSNSVEISGDILKCTESCQVGVFVKSKADAEHSIYLAGISTPISSIGFNQDNYSQKFVEDSEENIVLTYPTTTPDNAIVGLPVEEVQISVSDTSIAEIGDIGEPLYRIPVRFKKPGSVELTIKYNDFTATTVVKCYLEKAPETIIAPDSVKGYKGYTNSFYVDFGPDQEVNKDVIFEVIEGKDIVSLSKSKDYTGRAAGLGNNGHYCYYDGIGIGKAVIRAKSAVNENVYKDVVVEITDDPAPAPTLTIMLNGREEVPVKNDSITVEKDVTLVFQYSYVAMPNEGSSDFLGTENLFNQVEASKILDIAGGGGGGGDILSGFRIAFRTVEYGSDTFEVLPGKNLTVHVVEKMPVYVSTIGSLEGNININNAVMEDGTHTFDTGSSLHLSADPKAGYHFDHWVINGQENKTSNDINGALEITVDEDTTIAAVFTPCDDQEVRGEIKSTCTVSGYSGDVYCKRHNVLIKQGETLPMTDHNYVDHICTECLEAEEGYTAFLYEDENGKMHAEVNTVVGFADVKDEYSLIVGSPVTVSQELKYEKEPSGKYMLGLGSDPVIKDDTVAKAVFDAEANTVTVTPLKAGTTVLTLDLMGYKKEVTIKVQNTPVTFTVKENPQGAVIVNGVEMKDGANTVESGIRTNMFTIPNPGYHFDYWIIDGEKTKGVFGSNGGLKLYPDKDLTVQAFFKACDDEEVRNAVKPTCTKTGYSGDVYCKTNNVLIKNGEVLPVIDHNYVDHICTECGAKEEVPEEKPEAPVTDTIKEEVVIDVPETIPEEVAETIKESISEVKVEKVVESIPEAVKNELITELLKEIDTTDIADKDVQIKVVNTVKVTEVDLKSENKTITYEIRPKAVVTVDGVEVKTKDLKNDQLSGGKDIEITLPINGLDLKEIVHKSEGYPTEYIYEFVISKEGTVTFKISHFSSFTLNEVITKPAESSTGNKPVVNTGDHTEVMLYGGIGIVALIGALAVILFRRKHA